jgi:hypothetical protein
MHESSVIDNPQLRCTHLHHSGKPCGSFALRGERFCYHHHPSRPPARNSRQSSRTQPFSLPVLLNRQAVQIALAEVAIRIADNTLDTKRAALLLQCLQTAAATHTS